MGAEGSAEADDVVAECLAELSDLPTWYAGYVDPSQFLETAAERLRAAKFENFFKNLGISVGGFLYLDQVAGEALYKFFSDAAAGQASTEGIVDPDRNYMIGYQRHGFGDCSTVDFTHRKQAVDLLFNIHRSQQNPFEEDEFGGPEYFSDLPIPGRPDPARPSLSRRGEPRKRKSIGNGVHYVDYGEMIFVLLLWRCAVRRIWKSRRLDQADVTVERLWQPGVWQGLSYETGLAKNVATGSGTLTGVIRDIDACSTWPDDLAALLLLGEDGRAGGAGLKALQTFLRTSEYSDACDADLSEFTPERFWTFAEEKLSYLWKPTAEEQIKELHRRSTFPILPYFYWSALSRIPQTHAVVPIWSSITSPVTIGDLTTPIISVAVVTLTPLQGLDGTVPGDSEKSSRRLSDLCSALRLIAQAQVDSAFYARSKRTSDIEQRTRFAALALSQDGARTVKTLLDLVDAGQKGVRNLPAALRGPLEVLDARLRMHAWYNADDKADISTEFDETDENNFEPVCKIIIHEFNNAALSFALATDHLALEKFLPPGHGLDQMVARAAEGIPCLGQLEMVGIDKLYLPKPTVSPSSGADIASRYSISVRLLLADIFEFYFKAVRRQLAALDSDSVRATVEIRAPVAPPTTGFEASLRLPASVGRHPIDIRLSPARLRIGGDTAFTDTLCEYARVVLFEAQVHPHSDLSGWHIEPIFLKGLA